MKCNRQARLALTAMAKKKKIFVHTCISKSLVVPYKKVVDSYAHSNE
jgi:hypothetical protein